MAPISETTDFYHIIEPVQNITTARSSVFRSHVMREHFRQKRLKAPDGEIAGGPRNSTAVQPILFVQENVISKTLDKKSNHSRHTAKTAVRSPGASGSHTARSVSKKIGFGRVQTPFRNAEDKDSKEQSEAFALMEHDVYTYDNTADTYPAYRLPGVSEVMMGKSMHGIARLLQEPEVPWASENFRVIENYIVRVEESRIISSLEKSSNAKGPTHTLRKHWLPALLSEPALFHSCVAYTFMQTATLEGKPKNNGFIANHMGEAIKMIRNKLQGDPTKASSDAIIGSLFLLIGAELLFGNTRAAEIHTKGLRRMIRVRGGLENLGFNGELKKAVLMFELRMAATYGILPAFVSSIKSKVVILNSDIQTPLIKLSFLRLYPEADEPLDGFSNRAITFLMNIMPIVSELNMTEAEVNDIAVKKLLVKIHQICDFEWEPEPNKDSEDYVYESCRWAFMLYCSTNRYLSSSIRGPDASWIQNLRLALDKSPLESSWNPLPGALLWCLVVGNIATSGNPNGVWFVANMVKMTQCLGFDHWEWIEQCLKTFSWVRSETASKGIPGETFSGDMAANLDQLSLRD